MAETIVTKHCPRCNQDKAVEEFNKNRNNKDGYGDYCRKCANEVNKVYKHTAKGKASTKRYKTGIAGRDAAKRYVRGENGRKSYSRRYYENKQKCFARCAVGRAVKSGKLPRPDTLMCECGEQAVHYHHTHGYERENWLRVAPVCLDCHTTLHSTSILPDAVPTT